jgi:hypothetical protein
MIHEKSVLSLTTQQKYNYSHRVSLLSFLPTQQATRRASPTSGPWTMQAPLISDSGWIVSRVSRFSKLNSNSHERPGSTVNSDPTDGITDGLGGGGNMRLYLLQISKRCIQCCPLVSDYTTEGNQRLHCFIVY